MVNAHRKLGDCTEVFVREGGWAVQRVGAVDGVGEVKVEVLRGGMDTQQEAYRVAQAAQLPVFFLDYDPNAA